MVKFSSPDIFKKTEWRGGLLDFFVVFPTGSERIFGSLLLWKVNWRIKAG